MNDIWYIKFVKSLHELSNTSKLILFLVIFILLATHIVLSFYYKDFSWLAAFGALLSIFGLLSSFSYSLPLGEINPKDLEPTEDGEHYHIGGVGLGATITDKESIERIKASNIKKIKEQYKNISVYIILTITGTLIWAYSGFLNNCI